MAIAKTILYQLFEKRIGNVQLLQILGEAYEHSRKSTNTQDYENILWTALERALAAALRGAKELVIVVDGLDEAAAGEPYLFQKLTAVTTNAVNVKLVTLGAEKSQATDGLFNVPITEERISEDVSTVVRSNLAHSKIFLELNDHAFAPPDHSLAKCRYPDSSDLPDCGHKSDSPDLDSEQCGDFTIHYIACSAAS